MALSNLFGLKRADSFDYSALRSLVEQWLPRLMSTQPGSDGHIAAAAAAARATPSAAQAPAGNPPPSAAAPPADATAAAPLARPGDLGLAGAMVVYSMPVQLAADRGSGSNNGFGNSVGHVVVLLDENLSPGIMVDTARGKILEGSIYDPVLGGGDDDVLVLSNAQGGTSTLHSVLVGLEQIVFDTGTYDITVTDGHVGAGKRLEVNGLRLGAGDHVRFDGSAELDGSFLFFGSGGGDTFRGGAGDDLIFGHGGGDRLAGGAGADRFGYSSASESTGASFDRLLDFNPGVDRIDLPVAITGFNAAVRTGALSTASFDANLAEALGAAALKAGKAVYFTPTSGDLAGTVFLVADGNGKDGYQAGEDYVFALPAADPAALPTPTDFFI